jgi:hypothetical protein
VDALAPRSGEAVLPEVFDEHGSFTEDLRPLHHAESTSRNTLGIELSVASDEDLPSDFGSETLVPFITREVPAQHWPWRQSSVAGVRIVAGG